MEGCGMGTFSNIGIPGLILIIVILLLIFGPSKLPDLGKAVGQTFREFRNSAKEVMDLNQDEKK
jgi:sec-independent protein translocase protein TatA